MSIHNDTDGRGCLVHSALLRLESGESGVINSAEWIDL